MKKAAEPTPLVRREFVFAALIIVAIVAGCGEESKDAKAKPEVHKPTVSEIRQQFEAVLQPVHNLVSVANADTRVPPEFAAQVQTQLDERKKKYASEDVYKDGIKTVVTKLEDDLRTVRDKQNGVLALYLCGIIRYFDPNNSRVVRFEKWGETIKNRPVVVIHGWYQPRDTTIEIIYAFLEVFTPEDGHTHNVEVREGEEFLGLKFVKIIGDKSGIQFEYLKTNDRFEVYSPSWKRRHLQ